MSNVYIAQAACASMALPGKPGIEKDESEMNTPELDEAMRVLRLVRNTLNAKGGPTAAERNAATQAADEILLEFDDFARLSAADAEAERKFEAELNKSTPCNPHKLSYR